MWKMKASNKDNEDLLIFYLQIINYVLGQGHFAKYKCTHIVNKLLINLYK